jgi:hypothetical protein
MARWYVRRRRKAPRKKARFRVEGMIAAELGAKVGVGARTVRFYTAERLLPSPEFRGAATRYGREHLVCLAGAGAGAWCGRAVAGSGMMAGGRLGGCRLADPNVP